MGCRICGFSCTTCERTITLLCIEVRRSVGDSVRARAWGKGGRRGAMQAAARHGGGESAARDVTYVT